MLRSSGKKNAVTDTLQIVDEDFTSSELARAKEVISSSYCTMAEVLISEVFKRPVLWGHRIKNYNMDFVDKEWKNLSQTLISAGSTVT